MKSLIGIVLKKAETYKDEVGWAIKSKKIKQRLDKDHKNKDEKYYNKLSAKALNKEISYQKCLQDSYDRRYKWRIMGALYQVQKYDKDKKCFVPGSHLMESVLDLDYDQKRKFLVEINEEESTMSESQIYNIWGHLYEEREITWKEFLKLKNSNPCDNDDVDPSGWDLEDDDEDEDEEAFNI